MRFKNYAEFKQEFTKYQGSRLCKLSQYGEFYRKWKKNVDGKITPREILSCQASGVMTDCTQGCVSKNMSAERSVRKKKTRATFEVTSSTLQSLQLAYRTLVEPSFWLKALIMERHCSEVKSLKIRMVSSLGSFSHTAISFLKFSWALPSLPPIFCNIAAVCGSNAQRFEFFCHWD